MIKVSVKYNGQALAIVLIVLVIAIIIGMAIVARVFNDRVLVDDERSSSESIEIADTALDAVKDITFVDMKTVAHSSELKSICNPNNDLKYDFLADGCILEDVNDLNVFLNGIQKVVPTYEPAPYYVSITDDLKNQCNNDNNQGIKVVFERFDPTETIDIQKDETFALVTQAPVTVQTSTCNVNVTATPQGGGNSGIVVSGIYTSLDATGNITGYKPYEQNDINSYFLGAPTAMPTTWSGWTTSNGSLPSVGLVKGGYGLYELRLRAIGTAVSVSADFSQNCYAREDLMKVSAIVNCNGNSRGKEFVLTGEDWAPSIFDYVLFNGDGQLKNL